MLGLVRSHCGGLDATSTPGEGTEFRIYIPVCVEKPAYLTHTRILPDIKGRGRCVLVVDDEEPIRAIIGLALEHHGFNLLPRPRWTIRTRSFPRPPRIVSPPSSSTTSCRA